jgi:predicted secreted hydrolase
MKRARGANERGRRALPAPATASRAPLARVFAAALALAAGALAAAGCGGEPSARDGGAAERLSVAGALGAGTRTGGGAGDGAGRSAGADDGFARAMAPRAFLFPRDHGPHPEFRTEWWYYTGNLGAADGRRFGFQLTFFRSALLPPAPAGPPRGSAWAARQVFLAHFAVTDVAGGSFYAAERWERAALGLAGARAEPFRVWVGPWSAAAAGMEGAGIPTAPAGASLFGATADMDSPVASGGPGSPAAPQIRGLPTAPPGGGSLPAPASAGTSPGGGSLTPPRAGAAPKLGLLTAPPSDGNPTAPASAGTPPMRLRAEAPEMGIDLTLLPGKPPVAQGDHGLSRKSGEPGNASFYYSLPRMPASGTLRTGGESFGVTGNAWMDREWSTSALAAGQVGWDWFALQLADGRELMFYRLRRRDGSADPASTGTLIDGAGHAIPLAPGAVDLRPLGSWRSPRTGARYSAAWRLTVRPPASRSAASLELLIRPLIAGQELDLSFSYWEGAVAVAGSENGAPLAGQGYVEMTGYGEPVDAPAGASARTSAASSR